MHDPASRRRWFGRAGIAFGALLLPAWAERLLATPGMTAGPFYPRQLPLDDDNDLIHVKGQTGTASGVPLDLTGRVVDEAGRPLRAVQVEIWQCNAFGRYHHPDAPSSAPVDPKFQGFGRTVSDVDGRYLFRTIKPVPYPGRAPHIHFKLRGRAFGEFTTQMFVAGEPLNECDFIYRSLRDPDVRARQTVALTAAPSGSGAALLASYDIVLGR